MLKLVSKEISIPFSNICNTSFEGVFPDKNKIAKIIPSHKKGSTTDVNNYRPISLLSTFSKIMEKLMATRLASYLVQAVSIINHLDRANLERNSTLGTDVTDVIYF